MGQRESLNSSQALHLLTSCRYADQLLSEIESILSASASKSPFPKYGGNLSPVQIKVVKDYIARIRGQMVQVLRSQGIEPPEPQFEATRSIRVNLEFADIAFDECRPEAMRGYGDVPASLVPELNGLVQEMKGVLRRLSNYLAQDQDLEARLQRLEHTTHEAETLKTLERLISEHGLVQFRPMLDIILDRLESNAFQIAVFGRVSSGKSSLLNHVLGAAVLPVGVTPITAVPTRIMHGPEPRLTVTHAGRRPERAELERLPEFVSEEFNPGNAKHVTRILVELPARRLQDGVTFVDTPGLGSLATAGAAETLAYLPSCDLGVVLIDAGSTLNQEDLATLQDLYKAAIPALVLLSKADLLRDEDRQRVVDYTRAQIASQLGLKLAVHPVSAQGEHASLLDAWFEREIQPLYERHQELAQQSVRRKIGALRESVEAALKLRLQVAARRPKEEETKPMSGPARTEFLNGGGFCREHFWQAKAIEAECWADGFGVAILCENLLDRSLDDVKQIPESKPGKKPSLLGISTRSRQRPPVFRLLPGSGCRVCAALGESENHYLTVLEELLEDADFSRRYQHSAGLCFYHLRVAAGQWQSSIASQVIKSTADRVVRELIAELREFQRKHDYQHRLEPRGLESTSPQRAIEFLVGLKTDVSNSADLPASQRTRR